MQLYADVLDELRHRKVSRTANGPVGDYAEWLFSSAFGWKLEPNSAAGHDATDSENVRYQIKSRRVDRVAGSRQLGIIRRLTEDTFDVLGAVLFDRDMTVLRGALIPKALVTQRAAFVKHTNGWRFMLTDEIWSFFDVRDVTLELRAAASDSQAG
jgi:hypothetical protein